MSEKLHDVLGKNCSLNQVWIKKNKGFRYRLLPNEAKYTYLMLVGVSVNFTMNTLIE